MKKRVSSIYLLVTSLILYFLSYWNIYEGFGTWELNRTIGWGWDLHLWYYRLNKPYLWFTLGYMILYFSKRKTIFVFSIIHFLLLIAGFLSMEMIFGYDTYLYVFFSSWAIFLIILFTSRKY